MSNALPVKCPCHATPAEHEAFVARFVASLLDGSRYAALPEGDDEWTEDAVYGAQS